MTELVRRLNPCGFASRRLLRQRGRGCHGWRRARLGSRISDPGLRPAATVGALLAFARWCRRERIAWCRHSTFENIFGLPEPPWRACRRSAAAAAQSDSRRPDPAQRLSYRCATKVVANSEAARGILQTEGLAPGSIAVIPNGIDAASYPERSPDAATRPVRSVITVANLRPEKSHETLIAAARLLAADFPDVKFHIVAVDRGRRARSLVQPIGSRNACCFSDIAKIERAAR